jgi:GT2 family glycosyltransferase/peptidoglycan/xylan/chitin deacetylase (PgdA/CDA1 family)
VSRVGDATPPPRFSIVIPTFQRRDVVVASVRALDRQEGAEAFEAIVVVDGSTDGTAAALRRLEPAFPITVLEQANEGRAAACNRGAAAALGEFILFLDDDMEAHPRLLAEHARSHREGVDVVLGHIPLHPESPPNFLARAVGAWAEHRARALAERHGALDLDDLITGQMSLRASIFRAVGGFDTSFTHRGAFGGEDLDLGRRLLDAGLRISFNQDAVSYQRYVVTPRSYLRQWREAGRAKVLLARKHPDQLEQIFRSRPSTADRLLLRVVRAPMRELVLALAATGLDHPRVTRWFFRVRNLEHARGIREAGGPPARRPVRVLCYHAIADLRGARVIEQYGVPPAAFRRQLTLLTRYFRCIGAEEFRRFLGGAGVPRRALLLTFDDCFQDLADAALPVLREVGAPALAFVVTGRVGGTNDWDAAIGATQVPLLGVAGLRTVAAEGVELGSHTRTHRMLNRIEPEELADELSGSVADAEALGLPRPVLLAYPHGEHDADVRRAAAAVFEGAFTVEAGLARPDGDRYAIPRIEILRRDTGVRFWWKLLRA